MGVDIDLPRIEYARLVAKDIEFLNYDALNLPFDDKSFDLSMAIASLGFMSDHHKALSEMVRVTKRKVVVAVLNCNSASWQIEGKNGGSGGYNGAHWHTADEIRLLLRDLPIKNLQLKSAIFSTKFNPTARLIEQLLPSSLLKGAFLLASFEVEYQ